jgi:CRISPR-associated protein (TIGR02710 family)
MPEPCAVLLLTVGTGTRGKPVETILEPFRKSLEAAGAERNILLPSRETEEIARNIQQAFPQFPVEIRPLPEAGDENNADRCFEHYDAVIAELLAAGAAPESVIADITRGTKAMSAALLLAAAVRGVRRVRYLFSEQRNESGVVQPGTERVADIEPSFIFVRQTLLRAGELLRAGDFRAVEKLLAPLMPGKAPPRDRSSQEAAALDWAARFWGAWDRFDYRGAARLLQNQAAGHPQPAHGLLNLLPGPQQEELLAMLASALPEPMGDRVRHCRALAADLLANAERRLAEGRLEEVLVRVYRILELITTYRLFSHGIDSERVNWNDRRVREWLESRKETGAGGSRPGRALGRRHSAELLVFLEQKQPESRGAKIAAQLAKTGDWLGANDAGLRNGSILIHGLASTSAGVAGQVAGILDRLRDFFYEEHPKNRALHEAARFPFSAL